ncbi:MAG: Lrp/AsnC family transcriptional regulator [DPANN group archaeon]|nr:Lrp/AsnC family transcriptional regulator [DPANN group archaeon]
MVSKLDQTDILILKELLRDARQSFRQIAEKLEIAPGTVQSRIQKLESQGIIQAYRAKLNYEKLGYTFSALIGVQTSRDKLQRLVEHLKKNPYVYGIHITTGEYDLFVGVRMKSFEELSTFLQKDLMPEYADKTTTFMVLETKKEAHTLLE